MKKTKKITFYTSEDVDREIMRQLQIYPCLTYSRVVSCVVNTTFDIYLSFDKHLEMTPPLLHRLIVGRKK
jgi:hypothetical protein